MTPVSSDINAGLDVLFILVRAVEDNRNATPQTTLKQSIKIRPCGCALEWDESLVHYPASIHQLAMLKGSKSPKATMAVPLHLFT